MTRYLSNIYYGLALAALLLLLKWVQWKFLIIDHAFEIYAGIIAIVFTALGVWISKQLAKPGMSPDGSTREDFEDASRPAGLRRVGDLNGFRDEDALGLRKVDDLGRFRDEDAPGLGQTDDLRGFCDEDALRSLGLSNREYEVLRLLAKGYSNADIGKELFLSLSTIKTHVSNLFTKLEVKSRTQAIEKANRLKIIS